MSCPKCLNDRIELDVCNWYYPEPEWIIQLEGDSDCIEFCPYCGFALPDPIGFAAAEAIQNGMRRPLHAENWETSRKESWMREGKQRGWLV